MNNNINDQGGRSESNKRRDNQTITNGDFRLALSWICRNNDKFEFIKVDTLSNQCDEWRYKLFNNNFDTSAGCRSDCKTYCKSDDALLANKINKTFGLTPGTSGGRGNFRSGLCFSGICSSSTSSIFSFLCCLVCPRSARV